MALTAGTRLGPFEIADQIGAGGMGEVYRATDTRLDRTVAIKVLPEHLASDPQRRERFEREARAVSSLNHPHICTLHDIGEQDGVHYLVMEYVDGDTLQQRLEKGRLPLEQALEYAIQIADALDKAHRQGVVHRDLKPSNIMITKSGTKLLDFGLAKLKGDAAEVSPLSQMPTQDPSAPLTAEGTIIGTLQYMAPEQLEGKEADSRTDIFAFGAVVYEMVTGKKAFEGPSQASLISAIMSSQPQVMADVLTMSPPALDRTVGKCLAKEPDDRWQTARDLLDELTWIARGGGQAEAVLPAPQSWGRERNVWIGATVLLLIAFVALIAMYSGGDSRQPRIMVFPMTQPSIPLAAMALSPDGRYLAFVSNGELWLRTWDSSEPRPLPSTDGANYPFWSPGGRSIGFFSNGVLKRVELSGGPARTICAASFFPRGASWNAGGVIIFSGGVSGGLSRVDAEGGVPIPLTTLDESRQENSHRWPLFLPDGRHFLYLVRSEQPENHGIYVGSLDSDESRRLVNALSIVRYSPPGYLLFVRDGTLMAQGFDVETLDVIGDPSAIVDEVGTVIGGALSSFSVSQNGILAYHDAGGYTGEPLWMARGGKLLGTFGEGEQNQLRVSPDGSRLAITRIDADIGTGDIWIHYFAEGRDEKFTLDPAYDTTPVWSPDGQELVFASQRAGGGPRLYVKSVGRTGDVHPLPGVESTLDARPMDWSLDGQILYQVEDPATSGDVWVVPREGGSPTAYLDTEFDEIQGRFSPDGRLVAYVSNEEGRYEVYVRKFPSGVERVKVSTGGGTLPSWSDDGDALYYLDLSEGLYSAAISASELGASPPEFLFQTPIVRGPDPTRDSYGAYEVFDEGQQFLIAQPTHYAAMPLNIVLNWTSLLEEDQ